MLNHIVLMGRLTADPELRRTTAGTPVASFRLAVDRDFKDSSGVRQTDFIDCIAWRNTADFVNRYFARGRMAVVSGRLQIRQWKNKNDETRYSAEVVADSVYFGDAKPDRGGENDEFVPAKSGVNVPGQFEDLSDEDDGDLPF